MNGYMPPSLPFTSLQSWATVQGPQHHMQRQSLMNEPEMPYFSLIFPMLMAPPMHERQQWMIVGPQKPEPVVFFTNSPVMHGPSFPNAKQQENQSSQHPKVDSLNSDIYKSG